MEKRKESKAISDAYKMAWNLAKAQKKVSEGTRRVKKPKKGKKKASRWA